MISYKTRKINFKELLEVDGWQIKVYTISKDSEFNNPEFYAKAKAELSVWLKLNNGFNSKHNNIGFLILHAGTEGIFSLINWWVGDNMLNTHIFITSYDNLNKFSKISGDGLAPCVWELDVINHERVTWTNHVLKNAPNPDFEGYLKASFSKEL